MSVSETVVLPAQPTSGHTQLKALGGKGMISPAQLMRIRVNLASDASGGSNTITLDLDPVWDQLINSITVRVTGAAAAVVCDMTINVQHGITTLDQFSSITQTLAFSTAGSYAQGLWTPPPFLLEDIQRKGGESTGRIASRIPNVNGETQQLLVEMLLFNKRAFEFTPIEQLVAATGRATHFT